MILIEAPVFGGLGSAKLPSKNVFADTTILSEKEASNAILYPATSALLRRGSARALDVCVRAGSGRERVGVEKHSFGAEAHQARIGSRLRMDFDRGLRLDRRSDQTLTKSGVA